MPVTGRIACALLSGAALVAVAGAAPAPAPVVAAAPMHSEGVKPAYPRLTKLADAKVMAKVNALLATLEKDDRQAYADCVSQLKDMKQKPTADTWREDVTVRYLSARYLSVEVVTSYDCAGAYPTNGAETPVTYDLTTGTQIDWTTMFKPGFLAPVSDAENAPPPGLTKLYRARYRMPKGKGDDADCRGAITDQDPFSSAPIVWLDAKGGIVFQPDFPHVIAACGDPLTLAPVDVAPYLKDAKLAADLKAVVHK
jgi:hypothetical protein